MPTPDSRPPETTEATCAACAGRGCPTPAKCSEISRLRDAAENVVIAYGMGWDMDGVIDILRKELGT